MYYPIIYSNYMKACPLVRPSKPSLRYNLKVRFSVASTILDQIALPFHLISIKTSNFMFRPRVSSDLPTCLNPKPGGSGPKMFRAVQWLKNVFGPLLVGYGCILPQKILKISALRLAENAFPTF